MYNYNLDQCDKEYVLDKKEQVLVEKLILQLRDNEFKSTNIEQGVIEEICADIGIQLWGFNSK